MKLHHLVAIAAVTTFAGAVSAQAAPIGQPSQPSTSPSSTTSGASGSMSSDTGGFAKLDKDRDGSISKKEAASNKDLTKQWDTLDTNKDGKLDQGEFAQFEASGSSSGATSTDSSKPATDSSKPSSSDKPKF